MAFTAEEYQSLLAVKGIGKTFISRLEQMGLDSVQELATTDEEEIVHQGAYLTGSSCWKNSPQARQAAHNAVDWAKAQLNGVAIEFRKI